jgi:glycerol uptake facilitator-like aquaporin
MTGKAPQGRTNRAPERTNAVQGRAVAAEALGSALLAAVVVGSGITAQHLSPGDVGLELAENAFATGAGLYVLILVFGATSGAHFNPIVSVVDALFRGIAWVQVAAYVPAQVGGCVLGTLLANEMFARPVLELSTRHRATGPHFVSEVVATAGLLLVVFALARSRRTAAAPAAVGAYIGAAYFFTSSTSFANPAITIGRMFSNSFAGIAPSSVPEFIAAQCVGGVVGFAAVKLMWPSLDAAEAADVVSPHGTPESEGPR